MARRPGTKAWFGAAVLALAVVALCGVVVALGASGPQATAAQGGSWTTFMHDNGRSGYDSGETAINAKSAPKLAVSWKVKAGGEISDQAVAANGLIYWGSWDGVEHATDPMTHKDRWRAQLGSETKRGCQPPHIGIGSTATVATVSIDGKPTSVVFVGGGDGSYYALNAITGRVIWSRSFGSTQQGYFMWSSPAIAHGSMYVGVASIGDCPAVPGAVEKLDVSTGTVQSTFATVPSGCVGGAVWASPAIDASSGHVYVATGNIAGGCTTTEPHAQALLELTSNLSLVDAWQIPKRQLINDADFGATPTLFSARIHGAATKMVGVPDKNGIYYAFGRGHLAGGPVWEHRITTNAEDVSASAWDGKRLLVAASTTVIGAKHCAGSVRALDPGTGKFIWSDCLKGGGVFAAVTAAPGVVFEPVGSILYGLQSTTGRILFHFQEASGAWFYSPPMFSGKALYIGSPDGNFYKFVPR